MLVGMENIIVNFHYKGMSTKHIVFYETTVGTKCFLKTSCRLGLASWLDTKLHNSKCFQSICMKFSRLMCLGIKNICRNFCCKRRRMKRVNTLSFSLTDKSGSCKVNDIHMSFRNRCI